MAIVGRDQFKDSRGGKCCHNLIAQIEAKTIDVTTESVWAQPGAELSVRYRNITEAHFRLVKADWTAARKNNSASPPPRSGGRSCKKPR